MGGNDDCDIPADIQKLMEEKTKRKLTESESKKIKQWNKAKANPGKSAAKLEKQDAKRARRKESGSVKVINR